MSAYAIMNAKHLTLAAALTGRPATIVMEVATLLALLAFAAAALARRDMVGAWAVAAVATVVVLLRGLITTKLGQIVNPIHVFAASMWIGTLFVLVAAGITTALSGALTPADRGPTVALMVNRFSTIALASAGVLVLTGVITAWTHLKSIPALWTSIYGQTLIVKLIVVAGVFALGAYHNQRMKPSLGTEDAGRRLTRSATFEIALAAIVLVVTAVLVNLPTPAELLLR
ncbi:MAG: CopD family protein [Gemmatimonadaceae bacterium]|nr:CopD family protein [Gemmatimonadaceae bacterium]